MKEYLNLIIIFLIILMMKQDNKYLNRINKKWNSFNICISKIIKKEKKRQHQKKKRKRIKKTEIIKTS